MVPAKLLNYITSNVCKPKASNQWKTGSTVLPFAGLHCPRTELNWRSSRTLKSGCRSNNHQHANTCASRQMLMPGVPPLAKIITGTDRKQICSRSLARLQTLSESCHGAWSHISNCLLSLCGKSGSDSTRFVFLQDGAIIGGWKQWWWGDVGECVQSRAPYESLLSRYRLWKAA